MPFTSTVGLASLVDTCFVGRIAHTTTYAECAAVIPKVEGSAYITARHEFLIALDDPLKEGFALRVL